MAVGGSAGPGFRVILKGCPRGSSGGIIRLFTVMSIVITDSIGLRVVVYDVKPGVVVDGCVRRLEVVDPWGSCAGGVSVFTLTARARACLRLVKVFRKSRIF